MNTKEFFDYLLYIGVVSNDSLQILTSIVEQKLKENENNKNIDKQSFMKSLIGDYLSSLNKEELTKIGFNIYEKYILNKSLTISKHLSKMFSIIHNIFFQKIKLFFIFWKNLILDSKTIKPKFFQRSKSSDKLFHLSNSKQQKLLNINSKNYNNNINKEFFSILDNYKIKNENDKKKAKIMTEDDLGIICTFTPNLSLTKKRNNKFRRKTEPINQHHKVEVCEKKEEKPKKKVDNDRMNKLYNDFQRKNVIKEKLTKNIDKENGITFSPKINHNSPYNKRIKDNFYERNKKLLKDKKIFVDGFYLLRDLQMKGVNNLTKEN